MPSPSCVVNATSTVDGVNVTSGGAFTIQLVDDAGVKQWSITCISTDELQVAATVTAGLSVNYSTFTATGTTPSEACALIFQSQVNNGLTNGRPDPTLTTTFGVYVLTSGSLRVGAFDETLEGDAAFGWVTKFNQLVRSL